MRLPNTLYTPRTSTPVQYCQVPGPTDEYSAHTHTHYVDAAPPARAQGTGRRYSHAPHYTLYTIHYTTYTTQYAIRNTLYTIHTRTHYTLYSTHRHTTHTQCSSLRSSHTPPLQHRQRHRSEAGRPLRRGSRHTLRRVTGETHTRTDSPQTQTHRRVTRVTRALWCAGVKSVYGVL